MQKNQPCFIAHRGESYDAPENTLASVNLAWERGVGAVEVDVHCTADNQICVIHDSNTLRTTGKKLIVRKSKLSELQQLDAGAWKGEKWTRETIPSLKQVIASVPVHGKLIVEIKGSWRLLDNLKQDISTLSKEQVVIIAFNLKTLARAKKQMHQLKMLWLIESKPLWCQLILGTYPKAIIKKLKKYGIDGINIGDSRYLTKKIIKKLTSARIPVYTWTVNDPDRATYLLNSGVQCITTDRAAWLKKKLNDKK